MSQLHKRVSDGINGSQSRPFELPDLEKRGGYITGVHYQWLDLLRFLAAFAVLICHARGFFLPEYGMLSSAQKNIGTFIFYFCTRLGEEAVIFFFLLSVFLVGGRGFERLASHSFNWKSYCIDRFARIFPPLFGALLFCYISSAICYGKMPEVFAYIGNLFSLQGIFVGVVSGPFWSLAYEVWFYVILGGISIFFCNAGNRGKLFLLILFCFVAFIFTRLSVIYLFIWCLGALTYFIRFRNIKKCYWIIIAGMLLLTTGMRQISSASHAFTLFTISHPVSALAFALSGALFTAMAASVQPSGKISLLISSAGRKLAAFSYTLYLTHYMTFRILEHCGIKRAEALSLKSFGIYAAMIIIAVFVAYLLYLPFEKQTVPIKTWLKKNWKTGV